MLVQYFKPRKMLLINLEGNDVDFISDLAAFNNSKSKAIRKSLDGMFLKKEQFSRLRSKSLSSYGSRKMPDDF